MKARLVGRLRRDEAQAAHELGADRDAPHYGLSGQPALLRGREHRRHDHGSRVDRTAFEGVVEIFAVRGGTVHEGGAGGVERASVANSGAAPRRFPALKRCAHVVGVARRDAESGDVDEELLDDFARRLAGARNGVRQLF